MRRGRLKCLRIVMVEAAVVFLGYPIIHETGHVITSVIVGAEVCQITLFPIPSVMCNVGKLANIEKVLIGFGGMLLPVVTALIMPKRWFITWIIRCMLLGISTLAFAISIISVTFDVNLQDDMIQVLAFWDYSKTSLISILCVSCAVIVYLIVIDQPYKQICDYFEI